MSNLGFWGSSDFTEYTDRDAGLWALKSFHKYNKEINPQDFELTLEEFIEYVDEQPGGKIMGLGLGIKLAEMSEDEVDDAMWELAKYSEGRVPKNMGLFQQYLAEEVSDLDLFENPDRFFEFVYYSAVETGEDIVEGVVAVGEGTIKVGKGALFWAEYSKYIIPVAFAGGIYMAWKYYGTKVKMVRKFMNIKQAFKS